MIALDEEMVGSDADEVIVQGLRSCLALFARIRTGMIYGAHFTTGTPAEPMNAMLNHIRDTSGSSIDWMAMVAKFNLWAKASSGLTSRYLLAARFRDQTGFAGMIYWADVSWAPSGYDIKCSGNPPMLGYRRTPDPNPMTVTPLADVFMWRAGRLRATNSFPTAIHNVPTNTSGFSPLDGFLWRRLVHGGILGRHHALSQV
ncbi:MAG: hypothetical protein WBL61_21080 [Bryobacteraceae bacterium]